jgi:hypothetical protein
MFQNTCSVYLSKSLMPRPANIFSKLINVFKEYKNPTCSLSTRAFVFVLDFCNHSDFHWSLIKVDWIIIMEHVDKSAYSCDAIESRLLKNVRKVKLPKEKQLIHSPVCHSYPRFSVAQCYCLFIGLSLSWKLGVFCPQPRGHKYMLHIAVTSFKYVLNWLCFMDGIVQGKDFLVALCLQTQILLLESMRALSSP